MSFTAGATYGKYQTTDIIKHYHEQIWPNFVQAKAGNGVNYGYVYDGTPVNKDTYEAGNVNAINLIQPSIAVNIWRRTA